jgi:DNA invertase Pin-like site-specific DNA recombinase
VVALSDLCLNVGLTDVTKLDDVPAAGLSRYAPPEGPRKARVTTALRADVVARYQRGGSSREVADTCGVAKSTVLKILRSEDIDVRPWGVRY